MAATAALRSRARPRPGRATGPDFTVPAYDYIDLGARYAFEEGAFAGASVWVGVDNTFDEDPPIFPTWQQANTDPSVYDVLGRSYYLRLRYAFR